MDTTPHGNRPRIFYPPADQRGKYHEARKVTDMPACGAPVMLNRDESLSIHWRTGERAHPILCGNCRRSR